MGYIKTEQERQTAIIRVKQLADNLNMLRSDVGGIGLSDEGINVAALKAMQNIDRFGFIDSHEFAKLVDSVKSEDIKYRTDMPHAGDQQLSWLTSIQSYRDASSEQIRKYLQPAAMGEMTRDASGKTLKERFDERVSWLHSNRVHAPKQQETVQPAAKPLTEREQLVAKAKADVVAIRAEIDGLQPHYSSYVQNQKTRLHKLLNELIGDHRGINEIKKVMARELRDRDNPIR
jgi:hypothetical protein